MLDPDVVHDMKTYFNANDAAIADVNTLLSNLRFQGESYEIDYDDGTICMEWFHQGRGMATIYFLGNGAVMILLSPSELGVAPVKTEVSNIDRIIEALKPLESFTGPVERIGESA